jgi:hypothetical protein
MQLGALYLEQFLPKIVGESWVMIRDNRMRHAMKLEDLIHENSCWQQHMIFDIVHD